MDRLRAAAKAFEKSASPEDSAAFGAFRAAQSHWLEDYALFMALESAHPDKKWWEWPTALATRDTVAIAEARKTHTEEVAFWALVQWWFDTQALALKAYANE
jgi:4-alpha-glucanotransferase